MLSLSTDFDKKTDSGKRTSNKNCYRVFMKKVTILRIIGRYAIIIKIIVIEKILILLEVLSNIFKKREKTKESAKDTGMNHQFSSLKPSFRKSSLRFGRLMPAIIEIAREKTKHAIMIIKTLVNLDFFLISKFTIKEKEGISNNKISGGAVIIITS